MSDSILDIVEEGTIFLEPREHFDKGIVGVADNCHIVYDYDKLTYSLAYGMFCDEEDPYTTAIEWVDYNTLRAIPYMDSEFRPIVMMPLEDEQ